MSKENLVNEMAKIAGVSKAQAELMLTTTLDGIRNVLKHKGEVRLIGFGTFEKVRREAKQGRNPRTGATIKIPASNQARFKPGTALKAFIQ